MMLAFDPTQPTDQNRWARYEPHMRRVIMHVYDHLDETLDLLALADVACLSACHWHRIYHAMYGETLAHTVKRLRLHRAAGHLAHTDQPIVQVARRAGYPSVQSFNRTFKSAYGVPPGAYRLTGQHRAFSMPSREPDGTSFGVVVEEIDAIDVVVLDHRGSYMAIGRAFDLLFTRLAAAGLARPGMTMYARFFDDPDWVDEAELRSQAAVAGFRPFSGEAGLQLTTLLGGRHAVLTHTGPYATMKAAYRWLYGRWLPTSDHAPAAAPVVEQYLNSPREVEPNALRSRIYLPLMP